MLRRINQLKAAVEDAKADKSTLKLYTESLQNQQKPKEETEKEETEEEEQIEEGEAAFSQEDCV